MHRLAEPGLLIGRDPIVTALGDLLTAAAEGRGSIVLLCGDPGIGKTRLLEGLAADARAAGFTTASIANFEHARTPFGPLVDLVRAVLAAVPEALPSVSSDKAAIERFVSTGEAAEPEVVVDQRRLFVVVAEFFERAAAKRPLLLACDDAQWSDPETNEMLAFVAPRVANARIMIALAVATAPETPFPPAFGQLLRYPTTHRIEVGPLPDHAIRMLAAAAIPESRRLDGRTFEAVCRRSEGNPLFLLELVRDALDGGEASLLPPSVQSAALERLLGLEPAHAGIVETAAVIGRVFGTAELAAAAEAAPRDVVRALRSARDAGIITEYGTAGDRFAFRHELIRAAIYDHLLALERVTIHRAYAQSLAARREAPQAILAHHWFHGGDPERAAVHAIAAGDEAIARNAHASACELYRQALDTGNLDPATRAQIEERLARAHETLGDTRHAADLFEAAAVYYRQIGDVERAARLELDFANAAYRNGAGYDVVEACHRITRSDASPSVRFGAHVLLALYHAYRIQTDLAEEHIARADACEGERPIVAAVQLESTRANLANIRDDAGWLPAMERAVALAESSGNARLYALTLYNFATRAHDNGRWETAAQALDRAIAVADANGVTFAAAYGRYQKVDALRCAGELRAAYRVLLEAVALHVDSLVARIQCASAGLGLLSDIDRVDAVPTLRDPQLLEDAYATGEAGRFAQLAGAHVELNAIRGAPVGALVARALDVLKSPAFNDAAVFTFARYGDAKDLDRVEQLVGAPPRAGMRRLYHLATQTVLAKRRGDAAEAKAKASVLADAAQRDQVPLLLAFAYESLGRLPDAIAVYERIGAIAHVRRLGTERSVRLTPRENEIAKLVGTGLSNRAIAEQLVLSERTVEHHVAAIYAKLGFRSRTDLLLAFRDRSGSVPSPGR